MYEAVSKIFTDRATNELYSVALNPHTLEVTVTVSGENGGTYVFPSYAWDGISCYETGHLHTDDYSYDWGPDGDSIVVETTSMRSGDEAQGRLRIPIEVWHKIRAVRWFVHKVTE